VEEGVRRVEDSVWRERAERDIAGELELGARVQLDPVADGELGDDALLPLAFVGAGGSAKTPADRDRLGESLATGDPDGGGEHDTRVKPAGEAHEAG
jgi:hypothetical protein